MGLAPVGVGLGALIGAAVGVPAWRYARCEGARGGPLPFVAGSAAATAGAVAVYGAGLRSAFVAAVALGLWIAVATDLGAWRIPNRLVVALLALGAVAQLAGAAPAPADACLTAAALTAGAGALLVTLARGGLGWGDAKLATALAWLLGPTATAAAMVVMALTAGIAAAAALLSRRRGLRDPLPLAPFLLAGGLWGLWLLRP